MRNEQKSDKDYEIMTIEECARYLKTSKTTIYRLAQEGKIPAIKLGNQWRFRKEKINEWLSEREGVFFKKGSF